MRTRAALTMVVLVWSWSRSALADETDNFTCGTRPLAEAQDALDGWMNAALQASVATANRPSRHACGDACLLETVQRTVGGSLPHPVTLIPHSRVGLWAATRANIERCHLAFRDSIYGASPYDQPWLFPFTGRVIFLADSIRLAGRIVGIDKLNHFIREGLSHWRDVARGSDIESVLARELGAPRRQLVMNEHGLKGLSLTGVVSYADLAAGYSGFQFWSDVLSPARPSSFVGRDGAGRFVLRKAFRFADYVNDGWDETINRSSYDPRLERQVTAAMRARNVAPLENCHELAGLPHAELYVNPLCLRTDLSR